jgi:hypothetical protein
MPDKSGGDGTGHAVVSSSPVDGGWVPAFLSDEKYLLFMVGYAIPGAGRRLMDAGRPEKYACQLPFTRPMLAG